MSMPQLPQRLSLPTQIANTIIEMIASGDLIDTLPGERVLAARLQVGRDSLRSALEILESSGHISTRKHGIKRAIIKKPTKPASRVTKRIGFLSPKKLHELPPWMLLEVDTIRDLLMPDTQLAGLRASEKGLKQAIESPSHAGTVTRLIDQKQLGNISITLEKAFRQNYQPTAIVGTRSHHILSVMSWLAEHGMSIPKNLSYISLSYEQWFEHFISPITHYHADPTAFGRSIVRKIISIAEDKNTSEPLKLIIPEFHKGSSVSKITT